MLAHHSMSILAAPTADQQLSIIMVLAAAGLIMAMNARRRRRSRNVSPKSVAREQIARLHGQSELKGDIDSVMVELADISRQINARIDNRFQKLEIAIHDAEQQSRRLEHLIRQAREIDQVDQTTPADEVPDRKQSTATTAP